VERTNNLVVVQEAPPGGSWGATLIARAGALERAWMPSAEGIAGRIRATLGA
jgi:hypothetical protein